MVVKRKSATLYIHPLSSMLVFYLSSNVYLACFLKDSKYCWIACWRWAFNWTQLLLFFLLFFSTIVLQYVRIYTIASMLIQGAHPFYVIICKSSSLACPGSGGNWARHHWSPCNSSINRAKPRLQPRYAIPYLVLHLPSFLYAHLKLFIARFRPG